MKTAAELAFDASHAGVRAAAVEGLASLVPNPLAQPLLAALLPQLQPLMCDAAALVRSAMADLLLVLRCALHRFQKRFLEALFAWLL